MKLKDIKKLTLKQVNEGLNTLTDEGRAKVDAVLLGHTTFLTQDWKPSKELMIDMISEKLENEIDFFSHKYEQMKSWTKTNLLYYVMLLAYGTKTK